MPEFPRAGGAAHAALAEGIVAATSAWGDLAKRQFEYQRQVDEALISSGVAAEYLTAKQIIDTNYINFLSSLRTDPDTGTFKDRYSKEMPGWLAEARKSITLPGAMQKLDEYLASESGLKDQQERLTKFTDDRFVMTGEKLILQETDKAVASGDWKGIETVRDDPDIGVYHSDDDIKNFNEVLIPRAKYNSVYNKLSALNPELALQLVKSPDDAKQLGIDMSVLTPEQMDAMTKQIQLERDYAVSQKEKAEAKVVGESDNTMLTAEIALLTGKGDPSTWLSPDLIAAQQWPGDDGARKAQYWINVLKADLGFLKEETVAVDLSAAYAVAFDPAKKDQQKMDEIRNMTGISGEDRTKVMNVVGMREQNPAYYNAARQVEDAFQRAMTGKDEKVVLRLAGESVRAQRQLEDLWLESHNTTLLNQAVDRILEQVKTEDLAVVAAQTTGAQTADTGQPFWRPAYRTATIYEYLREQGNLPVGAATADMIKKAHELEIDTINNAKMPEIKKFYSVLEDGTYIYSSKKIEKDKAGNIVISTAVPLYQVRYQLKPAGIDKWKYVATLFKMNYETYQFDIAVWEQK